MDRSANESPKPRKSGVVPPFVPRRTPTPLSTPAIQQKLTSPFTLRAIPTVATVAQPATPEPSVDPAVTVAAEDEAPAMQENVETSDLSAATSLLDAPTTDEHGVPRSTGPLTSRVGDPESDLGIEVYDNLMQMELADAYKAESHEMSASAQVVDDAPTEFAADGQVHVDHTSSEIEPHGADDSADVVTEEMESAHPSVEEILSEAPTEELPVADAGAVALSWDTEEQAVPDLPHSRSSFEFDSYSAFAGVETADAATHASAEHQGAEMSTDAEHADAEHARADESLVGAMGAHTHGEIDSDADIEMHHDYDPARDLAVLESVKEEEPWAMAPLENMPASVESQVADALERIAARVRSGEIVVPGGMRPDTDQAALTVAMLAIQLGASR